MKKKETKRKRLKKLLNQLAEKFEMLQNREL
jgi:hypothetical protein